MIQVLSPWHPATIKPVHPGAYLTRLGWLDTDPLLMWWGGEKWLDFGRKYNCLQQTVCWQGLAFDPATAEECDDAESPDPWHPRRGWWVPAP